MMAGWYVAAGTTLCNFKDRRLLTQSAAEVFLMLFIKVLRL
jgi:hypothetical protein